MLPNKLIRKKRFLQSRIRFLTFLRDKLKQPAFRCRKKAPETKSQLEN